MSKRSNSAAENPDPEEEDQEEDEEEGETVDLATILAPLSKDQLEMLVAKLVGR